MSEKFTPGPWVVQNGTDVFTGLSAKRRDGVESATNDGWHIADCSMGVTFDTDGQERTLLPSEMVANAHLISAAPAMYDALKLMVELHGNTNVMPTEHAHRENAAARMAISALKKARGES